MRRGDLEAAEDMQARIRRDVGLDALDFGGAEGVRRSSLALACQSALYGYLGLEEVCLSGVEKVAWRASADGLPLPGYVAASWPNQVRATASGAGVLSPPSRLITVPHPVAIVR